MPKCSHCGESTSMPYKCKFCGELFCSKHRIPENHNCQGLEDYKEKRKDEKKEEIMYEPFIQGKNVEGKSTNSISNSLGPLETLFRKKSTYIILGVMLIGFILQLIAQPGLPIDNTNFLVQNFGLKSSLFWSQPWIILSSIFLHGSLWHLFANGMTLYFLGSRLEELISKKYFLITFFGGGIAGGLFYALAPIIGLGNASIPAIGASGAIYAVGAALAILRPKLKVFIFPLFIPVPLYIAIFGVFFILSFFPGVAWQGHLGGLIIGVLMGYWLKKNNKVRPSVDDLMKNAFSNSQIKFNSFSVKPDRRREK